MARVPFKIRKGFDVTVSGSNFVITDNGVAINRSTPSVSGLDVNGTVKANTLQLQSNFMVGTAAVTGSTSATVLDTVAKDDFHTVKYLVAVEKADQSERQIAEVLMVIDKNANSGDGDAYISTYGVLFSGASAIATFSSDCSGDNARLIVTCTSAGCIVKAHRIATTTGAGSSASSSEVTFGLDNLDDVSLSSVSANQVLQWNGSSWVNATLNTATTFAALTDGAGALSGNGGKIVKVNSGATALEYGDINTLSDASTIAANIGGANILNITSGGIIPNTHNAIDLGSPTKMFRHVYISSGSLYIDGTKVMGSSAETISISADTDQNITIQTSGSGDVELDPTGTGAIQFKGNVVQEAGATFSAASGNVTFNSPIDMDSRKIVNLTTPTANTDAANKAYVDSEITSLIGGAPGALDTLNELAAALGDDEDYAATITTALAAKAPITSVPTELNDLDDVAVGTPSAGQVLQYNAGAGNFQPATLSTSTSIADGDGDTKIQVEESGDEDAIRFDTAGTQRMIIDNSGNVTVGGRIDAGAVAVQSWIGSQSDSSLRILPSPLNAASGMKTTVEYHDGSAWRTAMEIANGSGYQDLKMQVAGGNVGIGTASPSSKLEVNGTMTATTVSASAFYADADVFDLKSGGTQPSEIRLYCESSNAHYTGIRGPAHSGGESYILKLPNTAPSDNQILKVSGTPSGTPKVVTLAWEADGGSSALNDLSDVSTSGVASGSIIKYDGSSWVIATDATGSGGGASALNDLTDVSTAGASSGQVLKYNGSSWAPAADGGGSGTYTHTNASSAPSSPSSGDWWYDTANNVLYNRVEDSASTAAWVDVSTATSTLVIKDADSDTKIQVEESADEDKIRFDTGGTERMIIDSSGNLGLGTSSPSHPIHHSSGGYLSSGGAWTNASSRSLKKNIKTLTQKDADAAFETLEPKSFQYKAGSEKHLGFIAEDVHDLVATEDRKGLSAMDVVAVLTKVLKKQQKQIAKLEKALKTK